MSNYNGYTNEEIKLKFQIIERALTIARTNYNYDLYQTMDEALNQLKELQEATFGKE